jgi:hypothetical protein
VLAVHSWGRRRDNLCDFWLFLVWELLTIILTMFTVWFRRVINLLNFISSLFTVLTISTIFLVS